MTNRGFVNTIMLFLGIYGRYALEKCGVKIPRSPAISTIKLMNPMPSTRGKTSSKLTSDLMGMTEGPDYLGARGKILKVVIDRLGPG